MGEGGRQQSGHFVNDYIYLILRKHYLNAVNVSITYTCIDIAFYEMPTL